MILIEKIQHAENLCRDLSVISGTPFKITSKGRVRITSNPKYAPLIITKPGPIPYSSEKAIPWNYGSDVYYHGIKQELSDKDDEEAGPNIDNIAGTNKITRSGRIFSSEISPPVQVTTTKTTVEARGKEPMVEPARMKAPKEVAVKDTSGQEMEEVLKIIRRSDYKIVAKLG